MGWNLDESRPIWPQIKEILTKEILAGNYEPGGSFPTVRELAQEAKVNRNTMQRALSELENDGLVISNRTAGRTVTMDERLIKDARKKIALESIERFKKEMEALGFTREEIIDLVQNSDK